MKRNNFQLIGAVLQIIAGAFWLIVSISLNNFANYFGLKLELLQIIMPICFIISGVRLCMSERKKSEIITFAIIDLAFVGLQFYFGNYVGLGILQMVLLFISALLLFISIKYNEN